jgi:hypothetical protein
MSPFKPLLLARHTARDSTANPSAQTKPAITCTHRTMQNTLAQPRQHTLSANQVCTIDPNAHADRDFVVMLANARDGNLAAPSHNAGAAAGAFTGILSAQVTGNEMTHAAQHAGLLALESGGWM